MKIKIFLLFACLIILNACSEFSVTKNKAPYKSGVPYNFTEFKTAIDGFEAEYALKFAYGDDSKAFVKAYQLMLNGEYDSSKVIMLSLYNTTTNSTVKKYSKNCLHNIYELTNDYIGFAKFFTSIDSLNYGPIFNEFAKYKMNVEYNADADTFKLYHDFSKTYIKLKINGKEYSFILGLDMSNTCFYDSLGYNMDVLRDFPRKEDNSSKNVYFTGICENFNLGKFKLQNLKISRNNKMSESTYDKSIIEKNGVIGWNILRYFDFTIDYNNKILILRKPKKTFNPNRNLFEIHVPVIKFTNSDGINTYFDINNDQTFLFTGVKPKISDKSIQKKGTFLTDAKRVYFDVEERVDSYYLKDKNFTIELNKKLIVRDNRFYYNFTLDGSLGKELIEGAVLRFDATNGLFEILDN